jgi:hypothetical protein
VVVLLAASASGAIDILIDFDGDAQGNVANGFQSVDSDLVTFSDTAGTDLLIGSDPFITGGSNALASFFAGDDGGVRMDFGMTALAISLDFGNDAPGVLQPGDLFELVALRDGLQVALIQVVPNANVIIDQTLTFDAGVRFDAVEVRYTGAGTELIDNVLVTIVPEPSGALLFGLGVLAVRLRTGAGRPRRRDYRAGERDPVGAGR